MPIEARADLEAFSPGRVALSTPTASTDSPLTVAADTPALPHEITHHCSSCPTALMLALPALLCCTAQPVTTAALCTAARPSESCPEKHWKPAMVADQNGPRPALKSCLCTGTHVSL